MVKIFLGDAATVESEINSWIEVYKPAIRELKQSVVMQEKEHQVMVLITLLYDPTQPDTRVRYTTK